MISRQIKVENELGLHARVASLIVRETRKYDSSVIVQKDGRSYDLKNVTNIITVNAKRGDTLTVEFDGPDEAGCAEAMEKMFAGKFGEK